MFLLVMSGGGMPFVFQRNTMSIVLFAFAFGLFFFYKREVTKTVFNAITSVTLFFLAMLSFNYLFAVGSQSLLKYGFHLLTIATVILIVSHFLVNRNRAAFLSDLHAALKLVIIHTVISFFAYFVLQGSMGVIFNPITEHEYDTFAYLFYYMPDRNEYSFLGLTNCRGQGLFWEPGVLQIYLNLFLFLEMFVYKKRKLWILLAIFAVLTSQSTTGLIIMVLLCLVFFWKAIRKNILLIPLVVLLLTPIYFISKSNVEEKVVGEKATSFAVRYFDLTDGFLFAMDYPLTGMGLDDERYKEIRRETYSSTEGVNKTEKGNSNSIVYLFGALGVPITLLFILAIWKQTIVPYKRGLFFVLFVLSVSMEPVLLKPFFMVFVVSGLFKVFHTKREVEVSG